MNAGGFHGRWVLPLIAVLVAIACSPAPVPSASPAATPIVDSSARLSVELAGKIHCASFPYGCGPTLSVVPPGTTVADDWRPPATDPFWPPDYSKGSSTDHFETIPVGTLPRLELGEHELVISLLGSSDVVSLNPDGTRALDLLGRCTLNLDVTSVSDVVQVKVTFTPGQDFEASCSIEVN
jgi:hypothetical protein